MVHMENWEDRDWENVANRPQQFIAGPTKFVQILSQLMARRGYAQVQSASEIRNLWKEIVPSRLADESYPGAIGRGKLHVTVTSSAILQELAMQEFSILAKLKQRAPHLRIKKLKMELGKH